MNVIVICMHSQASSRGERPSAYLWPPLFSSIPPPSSSSWLCLLCLPEWIIDHNMHDKKLSEWKTDPKQAMTMMVLRLLLDVTINNLFSPPDVMSCKVYIVNWPNLQMFPIVSLFLFEGSAVTYICRLWILGEGPYKKKNYAVFGRWTLVQVLGGWGGECQDCPPQGGGWVVEWYA